ncbi:MAG: choice-of-anchor L domain-containing protein [Bacteroidetes bacterium]|nr:choice-of-anchor L domain-containing protein [Bacteroidota bacterium]MBS1940126.1 choice-of-anchor L domain-containing protein [Bacteroidota bacterium]
MSPRLLFAGSMFLLSPLAQAQLNVSIAMTPAQLVQNVLLGGGVTASNIVYTGVPGSRASFTATASNLGLDAGVILCTGDATTIPGMATGDVGTSTGGGSDNDLQVLSGQAINNAAILEFDFVPTGDSLKFRYVFGSEEYPNFVCSQYNDAFGFFLSGPGLSGPFTNNAVNIALVPGTSVPITINTINSGVPGAGDPTDCNNADPNWQNNSIYFVDNASGSTVAFNGFTTVLTAYAQVQCGQTYHIKLAIGNGTDESLQSGVFLEAGSFTSTGQVVPSLTALGAGLSMNDSTMFEGCGVIPMSFFRMGDTTVTDTVDLVIGGTATPGVDYYPPLPTQLIYYPGDTVITFPLNVPYDADGLETLTITITQNIVCSGTQVVNDYIFYIDQYQALQVVANDVNGACGQSYTIGPQVSSGTGNYGYLWSTGDTTATITVSPDTTTSYIFTVTDTCSVPAVQDTITVFIPVYAPMALTASPDTAIPCLGNANITVAAITGGNGVYNYLWTNDGTAMGTGATLNVPAGDTTWYRVTAFDECQHTATDSVMVTTAPLPDIQILSWDSTVFCIGDTVLLRPLGVTGGNGVYTYAWTADTGAVLSTADTLLVGVPYDAGYTLHVQDQCGYSADSVFTTLIPHYAPFRIQLTPDSTICAGDSIALHALVSGGSGVYTLDWEGWTWSDPVYTYGGDQDAQFTVDVLDHCGEFISAVSNVTVQHPEAHILIYNQGQDDWLFQAATVPFVVPVMIWDLGDGTRVKATSSTHSYVDLEDHWVTLHTVSAEGCKAVDSLLVIPPGTLFFPNAFTPDGDGINDDWGPTFSSVAELHYVVFDRWGHVVYETDDLHGRWDGTVNGGDPATTGVYVYKYRAKGHYYEANEKYGHVTLLRGSNGR